MAAEVVVAAAGRGVALVAVPAATVALAAAHLTAIRIVRNDLIVPRRNDCLARALRVALAYASG
jgi:hypothetical protein